ncbi:MAG: cytochrome C oxidase subunit IV family protein [Polyangiaceae bacterium]
MENDDKPENAETQPKSIQDSSEELPHVPASADMMAPNPKLGDHKPGTDPHDHGLAHTMPVWMLLAVLGALMVLTFLTVSVTSFDLGSEGNLVVGMVIATVKAGLVVTFFMHLFWDKKFHLILFLTAVLFVILFLSMSITDRSEYQSGIDKYQVDTASAVK